MQRHSQVHLSKDVVDPKAEESLQFEVLEEADRDDRPKETVPQIVLSDGLPAAFGGVAAMAIIGAPFLTILGVGALSAAGFTLLRSQSQS